MTLFIGRIPGDWNEERVRKTVKPFGDLKKLQLMKNVIAGMEIASVFLTFSKSESVEEAMSVLHSKEGLTGAVVRKEDEIVNRKITVNGITEKPGYISRLKSAFSQYGEIEEIRAVRWGEMPSGNGSALILYESAEHAQDAINAMNEQHMDGYNAPLQVQQSLPFDFFQKIEKKIKKNRKRRLNTIDRKIFVGGLSSTVGYNKLRDTFSPYGIIENVSIMRDKDCSTKSYAHVQYKTAEQAQDAVDAVDDIAMQNPEIIGDDQSLIVRVGHQPSHAVEEEDTTAIKAACSILSGHAQTIKKQKTSYETPLSNRIRTVGDVSSTTQFQKHLFNRTPTVGDVVSSTTQCQKPLSSHSATGHIDVCPTIGGVVLGEASKEKAISDHIQALYSYAATGGGGRPERGCGGGRGQRGGFQSRGGHGGGGRGHDGSSYGGGRSDNYDNGYNRSNFSTGYPTRAIAASTGYNSYNNYGQNQSSVGAGGSGYDSGSSYGGESTGYGGQSGGQGRGSNNTYQPY